MKPELITFDAAGTLVANRYDPIEHALECASIAGLRLRRQEAAQRLEELLVSRHDAYVRLNAAGAIAEMDGFWLRLTEDWLELLGEDRRNGQTVHDISYRLLFSKDTEIFPLFDDVLPILELVRSKGIQMAVLSNWDYTLHRVIEAHSIRHYFRAVFASLEVGYEKPDKRIFEIALQALQVEPANAVHVGDHPEDDLFGARNAGMVGVLLRRESPSGTRVIQSLLELPRVLQWDD